MKILYTLFLVLFTINIATSQDAGDFRTVGSGDWNNVSSWARYSGTAWVTPAPYTPTSADGTISILANHSITITDNVSIDETIISATGQVIVVEGNTLTVNDGVGKDLSVAGSLIMSDDFFSLGSTLEVNGQVENSGSIVISDPNLSAINFNANSIFTHNRIGGAIPMSNWDITSTIVIKIGASNSAPTGLGQTFGNFTWNSPAQATTTNLSLNGATTSILGDMSVLSTNSNILVISTGVVTLSIGGDLVISGTSRVALTSSGNVTINVGGDYIAQSSGLSFLATSGTGRLNVTGDFRHSNGELRGSTNSAISFVGTDVQYFTDGGLFTNVNFVVEDGATLDLNTSAVSGGGRFTVNSNGTVYLGSYANLGAIQASGSGGNIQVSGTRTYVPGATLVFNGIGAQALGDGFPNDVNLIIDNPGTVSLSSDVTIASGRSLTLYQGILAIRGNTLTLNGNTVVATGALEGGTTSNLVVGGTGDFGVLAFVNARTLNNFTINRTSSGNVTLGTNLTVLGAFSQTAGDLTLNSRTFTVSGNFTQTAGVLIGDASASLILNGSGTLPASLDLSGAFNTLTLNRVGGSLATSSSVTILNFNLTAGDIDNTGTITMQSSGTVTRINGTITNPLAAVTSYNVIYDSDANITTGPELPTTTTALNDFRQRGAGVLTLDQNVTVNGVLAFSDGTFDAGTNALDIKGNIISNAISILSASDITFSGNTIITGTEVLDFNSIVITGILTPQSNLNIAGDLTNNGTLNAGDAIVTFNGSTSLLGSSISEFSTVSLTGTLIAHPTSMAISADFVNNGVFENNSGEVIFNGTSNMIGAQITDYYDLTITGTVTSDTEVNVEGDFTNNGTFNNRDGIVRFTGSTAQTIGGTSETPFYDMIVINSAGVSVTGTARLEHEFQLLGAGVFDADGPGTGIFIVSSQGVTDDDARISDLSGREGNFTGSITVERYVDGPDDWRYISSPITNGNLGMWRDDFSITGDYSDATPRSEDPNVAAPSAPSIYYYNADDDSWAPLKGNGGATSTVPLVNGTGYSAYIYNTNDFTFDVRGPMGKGDISIPLTADAAGRYNLVGNPYPSAIDWDNIIPQTGLSSTVSVRIANGTFAAYNGSLATNAPFGGWSGEIAMGQSFWVLSTAATSLELDESVKTGNTNYFLREEAPKNYMRIALAKSDNSQRDEVILWLKPDATDQVDFQYDALKRKNGSQKKNGTYNYLNLSTFNEIDGDEYSINTVNNKTCNGVVGLNVADVTAGTYTLSFTDLNSFDLPSEFVLVDKYLMENKTLREGDSYSFEVTSDAASKGKSRFEIVLGEAVLLHQARIAQQVSCGAGEVKLTIGSDRYTAASFNLYGSLDDTEPLMSNSEGTFTTPVLTESTTYYVSVTSASGCESTKTEVTAEVLYMEEPVVNVLDNVLYSSVELGNQWFKDGVLIEGETEQTYQVSESGTYHVEVSDRGCSVSSETKVLTITGLNESIDSIVSLYPNPFSQQISIRTPDHVALQLIRIFDFNGRLILQLDQKDLSVGENTLDLSAIPSGSYVMQITASDEVYTHRIIKN